MSDTNIRTMDPERPATVLNVVAAVTALAELDEAALAELIADGRLHEAFPFVPDAPPAAPTYVGLHDLKEASVVPANRSGVTTELEALAARGKNQRRPFTRMKARGHQSVKESPPITRIAKIVDVSKATPPKPAGIGAGKSGRGAKSRRSDG